jgi:anti-anti-sigma factor
MAVRVVQTDERYSHVALSGQLTQFGVERMTGDVLTHTVKRELPTVVEMTEVEFLASAGLGLLASLRKRLQAVGAGIVLLNPSQRAGDAVRASRMDILLPIAETLEEALSILGIE